MDDWAHRHQVKLAFSRPTKPTANPFIESFNGKLREECLWQHWFSSLQEVQMAIKNWRKVYNQERPHRSLAGQIPQEYEAQRWSKQAARKGA